MEATIFYHVISSRLTTVSLIIMYIAVVSSYLPTYLPTHAPTTHPSARPLTHPLSYGHGGPVSSPYQSFFLDKHEQAVNQYFVHIYFRL